MSLADWLANRLIEPHRPSSREIANLLQICDRDIATSQVAELGTDWQLAIAYNAALQAATAALSAAGYRAKREGHHYRVIQSLAFTIGANQSLIRRFDKLRQKRNISDYERTDMVTESDAAAMLTIAKQLRRDVEKWIRLNRPKLANDL